MAPVADRPLGKVVITKPLTLRQIEDEMDRAGDKQGTDAVERMIDRYTQSQTTTQERATSSTQ